jgi:WD40 repeat protein
MHEMTAFERQVADEIVRLVGPARPVDHRAVIEALARPRIRRLESLLGAVRFAVAVAIVALFGGFLLIARPFDLQRATVPGAAGDEPVLPPPFGPARNGVIVAATSFGLVQVDPLTGATLPLLEGETHGVQFSPDGRRLLFGSAFTGSVRVMDADGSDVREVLPSGEYSWVEWASDSERVLVGKDGWLSIIDVETGDTERFDLGMDIGRIRWRPDHDQLVIAGDRGGDGSEGLYLVDADGTDLRALGPESDGIDNAVVSPDGSTIAYNHHLEGPIHLLDIDTGVDRELTFQGGKTGEYSPDGTRLLVTQEAEGPAHAEVLRQREMGHYAYEYRSVIVPIDGEGPVVVLGTQVHRAIGGGGGGGIFSPDGTQVLASYTQPPEGVWLFDAATGEGEEKQEWRGYEYTWQRLAP